MTSPELVRRLCQAMGWEERQGPEVMTDRGPFLLDLRNLEDILDRLENVQRTAPCPMCPLLANRLADCSDILGRLAERKEVRGK